MIGHAIDDQQGAAQVAQNAAHERIEPLLQRGDDQMGALSGAERGVVEVLGVCTGHGNPPSALRAENKSKEGAIYQGLEVPGNYRAPSGRRKRALAQSGPPSMSNCSPLTTSALAEAVKGLAPTLTLPARRDSRVSPGLPICKPPEPRQGRLTVATGASPWKDTVMYCRSSVGATEYTASYQFSGQQPRVQRDETQGIMPGTDTREVEAFEQQS
jgi:hypothetical protein